MLTSDTNNDQWLRSKERENNRPKYGGKQDLIDSEALICFLEHVQRESECREDTAELSVSSASVLLHELSGGFYRLLPPSS